MSYRYWGDDLTFECDASIPVRDPEPGRFRICISGFDRRIDGGQPILNHVNDVETLLYTFAQRGPGFPGWERKEYGEIEAFTGEIVNFESLVRKPGVRLPAREPEFDG